MPPPKPGGTTARGYGAAHQRERKRWALIIQHQGTTCTRCHRPITEDMAWDLDHDDPRTTYLGAAHAICNRGAGGRKARARARVRVIARRSRIW